MTSMGSDNNVLPSIMILMIIALLFAFISHGQERGPDGSTPAGDIALLLIFVVLLFFALQGIIGG
jgi:hypothetical protein